MDYKSRTYNPLEAVIIRGRVVIIGGGVDYNPAEVVIVDPSINSTSVVEAPSCDCGKARAF